MPQWSIGREIALVAGIAGFASTSVLLFPSQIIAGMLGVALYWAARRSR